MLDTWFRGWSSKCGVPTREERLDLANRLIQKTQQAYEYFERGGGIPDDS